MKTCPNCGCYVPDKWITCPACDAKVKIDKEALVSSVKSPSTYRVDVLYKYRHSKDSKFFERYESAYTYARRMVIKSNVYAIRLIDKEHLIGTMMLDKSPEVWYNLNY